VASRKGIIITAAIAAAVVGSSFLIWFIPSTSGGNQPLNSRPYQDTYSQVYASNNETATRINSQYQSWLSNKTSTDIMVGSIDQAMASNSQLQSQLSQSQPPQEWQTAFSDYSKALDSFSSYLTEMKKQVQSGNNGQDSTLDSARQQWLQYVNASINAVPLS
jgi:hypothetical protein